MCFHQEKNSFWNWTQRSIFNMNEKFIKRSKPTTKNWCISFLSPIWSFHFCETNRAREKWAFQIKKNRKKREKILFFLETVINFSSTRLTFWWSHFLPASFHRENANYGSKYNRGHICNNRSWLSVYESSEMDIWHVSWLGSVSYDSMLLVICVYMC